MKHILITGASSGIGAAASQFFASNGYKVFATYRRQAIKTQTNIIPVALDVCSHDSLEKAKQIIDAELDGQALDALICCAGQFSAGSLENTSLEQWQQTLQVNTVGTAASVQTFLPLLRAAKGRIILLSSVGGYLAAPYVSSYIASKFAVEGLADSLRLELHSSGIKVALVQPGAIKTAMLTQTSIDVEAASKRETISSYQQIGAAVAAFYQQAPSRALTPEAVVRAINHALTHPRPKTRYAIGAEARLLRLLQALLPDKLLDTVKRRSMGL